MPLVANKLQKKSRSFCDDKSKDTKEITPVGRTTLKVFELAADAKVESAFELRNSVALTDCEREEEKDPVFNWERKDSYPEIIITRCERQPEIIPEKEKPKRKMLFADFNEKCAERKKQVEQLKAHEQQLKEVSMEKYPIQWTKKKYNKSTFCIISTTITIDEQRID